MVCYLSAHAAQAEQAATVRARGDAPCAREAAQAPEDGASQEQQDYIDAKRLRQRLIAMNP
jgi:hypothetical protein